MPQSAKRNGAPTSKSGTPTQSGRPSQLVVRHSNSMRCGPSSQGYKTSCTQRLTESLEITFVQRDAVFAAPKGFQSPTCPRYKLMPTFPILPKRHSAISLSMSAQSQCSRCLAPTITCLCQRSSFVTASRAGRRACPYPERTSSSSTIY